MFSKILIAGRGEIAVRIIRACREMGIATVAVYSEADRETLHVAMADESYCIGGASPADSYLNMNQIISAALVSGAQAIHPGYGFLSENADFAEACRQNNLTFIGPSAEQMRRLSNKETAKNLMAEAGLEIIPGCGVLKDADEALAEGRKVGYPLMLKAVSGGGGRGIRLVRTEDELEKAYQTSVAEALNAFGDGGIYMEKYINPARHIEFQILADEQGNVVCLGDRDCTLQVNNQKILEESPSPAVSDEKRMMMIPKVIDAVKKTGYTGAGTLEFLMDGEGRFYFMEMNLRLQVEHTVTESLTGIDMVKWQIRIAAGIPLSFSQQEIDLNGSAIECRINAQAPGRVAFIHQPGGPFVRFDTYLVAGTEVTPFYDPLVGKLIVYSTTREEAVRKMNAALCELIIEGIPTNVDQQIRIVSSAEFL